MRKTDSRANERGMALVIAVLVLFVLTLLGIVMMASVITNRQVAGQSMSMRRALNTADAGVGEAVSHLRKGDTAMSPANPRSTAQVFLALAGSIPVVGADTTGLPTAQPVGAWLPYTTARKSPDVLTITYKTNAARTRIYRYDKAVTPAIHEGGSGAPIYEITSTGTAGNARRTIVTDVVAKPIYANVKGALCANLPVSYIGTADVCGKNHLATTPLNTPVPACDGFLNPLGGDMPATWSTGSISLNGASTNSGAGTPPYLQNQTGFYAGPWDMLGMTQADFIDFVGAPVTNPASLKNIVYIDNDLVMGNRSTSAAFHNVDGEGLLYVDGNLTLNANFTYKGLIYIEGDLTLNGQAWILGGMVVRGKTDVKVNGTATLLYSGDAISEMLAQYSGRYTTLSWREK